MTEIQTVKKPVVKEKLGKVSLAVGTVSTALVASSANAALDVSTLTTEISSNGDSLQTVMLAVLTLVALFVGYRMIRRAMG